MKLSTSVLVILLFFAGASLLAGMYTGLARLGYMLGLHQDISPLLHGPLMINGFLGTLISLERAAALEKRWAYGAPILFIVSTIVMIAGSHLFGSVILIAANLVLLYIMIFLYRLRSETYHLIMVLGAASLLTGNLLFSLGYPIFNLVAWWAGFLLLTIFAERLELNRIMRPPAKARNLFLALTLLWIAGLVITYFSRRIGWSISSAVLIAQALWLFKYDVARRTIKAREWTRYSAVCLLTGYGWLVAAGLFGLWHGLPYAGLWYDAQLHMIFLGFVFSMIYAHASVIIPSLSGKLIPYSRYFYLPLFLLHIFLILRIAGDIVGAPFVRALGGHGNVAAILLFIAGIIFQLARRQPKPSFKPV